MIQRIQSLYLLGASLLSGVIVLFTNFWLNSDGSVINFVDFFVSNNNLLLATGIMFYSSSFLSFITIFLYQNRKKQLLLGRVNLVFNLLIIFILIYYLQSLPGEISVSVKGIGLFIPFISFGLILLSNRAIKKDEELVKSVDRLR
ncbi:MAG: DUF4293 domain-containing protein [Flavobacteriaceae bacterium]|nr:DUF4293 domain-containing protein [Flavobacteriaceae bacterium]